jgi:non-ribosomal peptide synthase protein (TIGR01720 family)
LLLLDVEGHGREETGESLDLSRTVGWFTTIYPVFLELSESENSASHLKSIKEQLRSIPNRGMSFGLLRYLNRSSEIAEGLRDLPQAQVIFNYLGQFDQVLDEASMFAPCGESSGRARSRYGERKYVLDISAIVSGGKLRVAVNYSENLHRRESVRQLAESFLQSLRLIIDCQSAEAVGYIPSDFPQMEFDQKELDALIADLSESVEGQQ